MISVRVHGNPDEIKDFIYDFKRTYKTKTIKGTGRNSGSMVYLTVDYEAQGRWGNE